MPQFVMCLKYDCPKAENCFRMRASPDQNQPYNEFINLCNSDDEFRYFIKIRPDDKIIELNKAIKAIEAIEGGTNG